VIDNPIDYREIGDKSDDLHRATALGTEEGIDFIEFSVSRKEFVLIEFRVV